MAQQIGRREFLRLSAIAGAGAALVACQPQTIVVKETVEVEKQVEVEVTTVVEQTVVVEVEAASEKEAPMWAEMVQAGSLPPLDERLPRSPKVLSSARNEVPLADMADFTVG